MTLSGLEKVRTEPVRTFLTPHQSNETQCKNKLIGFLTKLKNLSCSTRIY